MKASRFLGNKTFAVTDLPTPHAGPGELVLRNQVCGVCGTDVHIYHGEPGSADVNPPVVLGHEYSGEVVEVGEGVTGFAVGDHVTVDPNIYCGHCAYCQNGKKQLCPSMEAIGVTRDGGFAQYSCIPASQAFKLEPTVPWEAAAMAEPLACCLHGIDLAGIQVGDKVCVVGGGVGCAIAGSSWCSLRNFPELLRSSSASPTRSAARWASSWAPTLPSTPPGPMPRRPLPRFWAAAPTWSSSVWAMSPP